MRSLLRLSLSKMKANVPSLLGLVLLITVGIGFFLTLFTIKLRYEESAMTYFDQHNLASYTVKGDLTQDSLVAVTKLDGVTAALGRTVQDVRQDDQLFRLISLTSKINMPYIYEGQLPQSDGECAILKRSSDAMGLRIGSHLNLAGKSYVITALVASPEYVYLYQNPRTPMAQADSFAVVYLPETVAANYNEILLMSSSKAISNQLKNIQNVTEVTARADQPSVLLYESDLDQIGTFAFIFPVIFALLIGAIIIVMLSRMVQKDRKYIGILKSLGMKDSRILLLYLLQFTLVAVVGALLGLLVSFLLGDWIISLFAAMFEVPGLTYTFIPWVFAMALVGTVALCLISGTLALWRATKLLPAVALRPKAPKQGKRILLEQWTLWEKLSFNTRYTIKGIIKGKWRVLVVVLGMAATCGLMAFSLGFANSVTNTLNQHMDAFANYDIIIDHSPLPLNQDNKYEAELDQGFKALSLPVRIQDQDVFLVVCQEGFDMVNIPYSKLDSGVAIPAYWAQQWGLEVGDSVEIDGYNAHISILTTQVMGLSVFTSCKYLASIDPSIPQAYNTIYGRDTDLSGVTKQLKADGISYATREDDKQSFETIMESMGILIVFLIGVSVVLGLVVLYSVGLISLSSKEFEYMFMGIMGYDRRRVLWASVKEMAIQLLIALPLGCGIAWLLLNSIKREFSTDNFVMQPFIASSSYLIAMVTVVSIALMMALLTNRRVHQLDIVQGLKEQDD